jgi:hypothetical protein
MQEKGRQGGLTLEGGAPLFKMVVEAMCADAGAFRAAFVLSNSAMSRSHPSRSHSRWS